MASLRNATVRLLSAISLIAALVTGPAWSKGLGDRLMPGGTLEGRTDDFIGSPSSHLRMQTNCNLVLYQGKKAVWASNTDKKGRNCRAIMQTDGNFVVYHPNGKALWATGTDGNPGAYIILQRDGNLVVYRAGDMDSGNALWASDTVH
jgi:hypothetical protein